MPLTCGHLWLPEVRLRNGNDEEFLPGQVYDNAKLVQVFINSNEQQDLLTMLQLEWGTVYVDIFVLYIDCQQMFEK